MQNYIKLSLLLSFLGFLKEFRPIESFLADYYSSHFNNITTEIINQEIFPIGTYSHLAQLFMIFIITDYVRHKPLIVVLGISSVAIWLLMLFVKGKLGLQVIEIIYGTFCATEIAYFSYSYSKTDKENYQIVTSHTRSSILFGKFSSALLAQLLVYYGISDYRQLNFITVIFQAVALFWCIFMIPSVDSSIYFHPKIIEDSNELSKRSSTSNAFKLIWNHFKAAYTNEITILWCLYYAFSFCLNFQITAYIQVLWLEIDEHVLWNATVDGSITLCGALFILIAGKIQIHYLKNQTTTMLLLIFMSFLQGIIVYFMAVSPTLLGCYILYVVYGSINAFCITICATKIAENLLEESHGLVFGFNTFVALITQTILTLSVVSNGYKLSPSGQYIVYGCLYLTLGIGYFFKLLIDLFKKKF